MKYALIALLPMLQACSMMPSSESNENAVQIKVEKNAISKDTDVSINVAVKNKDK